MANGMGVRILLHVEEVPVPISLGRRISLFACFSVRFELRFGINPPRSSERRREKNRIAIPLLYAPPPLPPSLALA